MSLRNRLDRVSNFEELRYKAIMGQWSSSDGTSPDLSYKVVFGDSPALSAGVEEQVWPTAADMGIPANAETLSIVSSSAQDDNGGSGIDLVFIEGLDGDYNPIAETVVLNGTAAVTSTSTFKHVYEINCLNLTTSGTTNAGNITVTNSTSGDTLGYVMAGDSISKHSQLVIPAGYNGLILDYAVSCYRSSGSGARRASVTLDVVPVDGGAGDRIKYRTIKVGASSESQTVDSFALPLVMGQKTMLIPTATAEANNTLVSVYFEVILVKETIDVDSTF